MVETIQIDTLPPGALVTTLPDGRIKATLPNGEIRIYSIVGIDIKIDVATADAPLVVSLMSPEEADATDPLRIEATTTNCP